MDKGFYTGGHKTVYWIIAIVMLTAMFVGLSTTFLTYQSSSITCIDDTVDEIMISKVIYSPECFVYEDAELGRSYPGTIDLSKFTNATLDQCFNFITKKISLTIGDKTIGDFIHSQKVVFKPIYVYDNGNIRPETLKFTFVEAAC